MKITFYCQAVQFTPRLNYEVVILMAIAINGYFRGWILLVHRGVEFQRLCISSIFLRDLKFNGKWVCNQFTCFVIFKYPIAIFLENYPVR